MFSRPKILFLVSLLFVALLNSIPTYLLNFQFFYQSSRKYHTLRCTDILLVYCYNALMQEMKLPLFYIGAQMRYRLCVLVF